MRSVSDGERLAVNGPSILIATHPCGLQIRVRSAFLISKNTLRTRIGSHTRISREDQQSLATMAAANGAMFNVRDTDL